MRIRHVVSVCAASVVLLVGPLAGVALAHVEVSSTPDATQGGSAALTFEVPSEKDLPTIEVQIALPTDTPMVNVTVPPVDGWTLSLVTAPAPNGLTGSDGQPVAEIVSGVVWTAIGVGIAPRESVDFEIGAGTLPTVDRIAFPVLQTYSDGSVVSWAQETVDGGSEPDFPAPVLFLAPGAAPAPALGTAPSEASSPAPVIDLTASASSSPPATATLGSAAGPTSAPADEQSASPAVTDEAAKDSDTSNTTTVVLVAIIAAVVLGVAGYAIVRRRQQT